MEIGALNMNEDGTYVLTDEHGCGCGGCGECDGNCEGCGGCGGGGEHEEVDEEEMEALEEGAGGCCGGGCCGGGCCGAIAEDSTNIKRKAESDEHPTKFIKKNDGEKCCGGGCCLKKQLYIEKYKNKIKKKIVFIYTFINYKIK